jgi:hypothetical protein
MIEETISDFKAIGIIEQGAIEIGLAQAIIINTLGEVFWSNECTTFGNKQKFLREKSDAIIVHLAGMLWKLKDSYGFEDFLNKNVRRHAHKIITFSLYL